jgi:serine phosphatase RsbU (regulator of sigma subunit)
MEPAAEVGGDYYDVIHADGRDWLVIGDVSGHGVSSGLVMMMVQTAVRTTLSQNPDLPPSGVLTAINRTIAENIQQLGESEHVTITVLSVHPGGRLIYAGSHEDILIYRAALREVERVETQGMWIGLDDNIEGMLENAELGLRVKDTLLLYTDGITESWRRGGPREDVFGDDQLEELFGNLGHRSLDNIRDVILEALEDYERDDDVTMLILRRVE